MKSKYITLTIFIISLLFTVNTIILFIRDLNIVAFMLMLVAGFISSIAYDVWKYDIKKENEKYWPAEVELMQELHLDLLDNA